VFYHFCFFDCRRFREKEKVSIFFVFFVAIFFWAVFAVFLGDFLGFFVKVKFGKNGKNSNQKNTSLNSLSFHAYLNAFDVALTVLFDRFQSLSFSIFIVLKILVL
jgi:hypothetical protein